MKAAKAVLAIAALCALSLAASAPAEAGGHGGHYSGGHGGYYHGGGHYYGHGGVGWGLFFGWPYYNSWYYPPYPAYYPYGYGYGYGYPYYGGGVAVPSGPTTYVERSDQQAAPERPSQSWWYYCQDSKTYYPYVRQCPGGWQKVEPQPPAQ